MPITRSSNRAQIEQAIMRRVNMLIGLVIQAMRNIGLEATTIARERHTYTDRTGNLTSSMGYCILQDGQVQEVSNFSQKKEGAEGVAIGMSLITQLERQFTEGLVLIIVAGMPYAQFVEARRVVLKEAEAYAKDEVVRKVNDVLKMFKR